MAGADTSKSEDDLDEAKEAFEAAQDAFDQNYKDALDDFQFARLAEQWPLKIRRQRELDGRPCLTINRLPSFIRQVVNDARQNKPSINAHPVDSQADVETAEIINGLFRHIEQSSDADVAYDTSLEHAVTGGFGYFGINTRYANDDDFSQDIAIEAKPNCFSIYGDPASTAADSSDWNVAFELSSLTKKAFEARWKDADAVSFEGRGVGKTVEVDGENITVAACWSREKSVRQIVALSAPDLDAPDEAVKQAIPFLTENLVVDLKVYEANKDLFDAIGVRVLGSPREVPSFKVTQKMCSGADVLETIPWAGRYIPIVPVYGEDINIEGRRHFRSLVRDAKDPQRMLNYWRPLALDTPIPTPTGWSTMGALAVGDQVFDERGQPAKVIGKSPVHIGRHCFRVTFDDGSAIVADAEHPWPVEERAGRTAAGTTWVGRMARTDELTPGKHFIATTAPLNTPDADLPVDPYVLGLWLGDGHTMSGRITPGDEDLAEIMAKVEARGYRCGAICGQPERHGTFTALGLHGQLARAGILGFKHIPAIYLRASEAQRRALLQGLMDTDGSVNRTTLACDFTTTSEALAAGFAELLRGLGIKAKHVERRGRAFASSTGGNHFLPVIQFYFTAYAEDDIFGLERKAAILGNRPQHRRRTKRYGIAKVERVSTVPVQCIAIDAPSHLFLAGEGMVPTHNTTSTELVALAPKTPFIGAKGSFVTDADKWATANTETHAYIEYDPVPNGSPPQRQAYASMPAGAIQEALSASDDMKSIMGLHDASLGARSNETSGVAIMARQREGDVSSFHFIDNLSRSIRHAGRIVLDLIPTVYSTARMIRILGPDGEAKSVRVAPGGQWPSPIVANSQQPQGQPMPGAPSMGQATPQPGQPSMAQPGQAPEGSPQDEAGEFARVFDLTAGKYDLVVTAGPSYTTQREEAASQMIELIRAYPAAAPLIGDLLAKNLDWPGAEEIAERFEKMLPATLQGADPQAQAMHAQVQQLGQLLGQAKAEIMALKTDASIEQQKVDVSKMDAETKRLSAIIGKNGALSDPAQAAPVVMATLVHILASPDLIEAAQNGGDPQQIIQALQERMGQGQPAANAPPQPPMAA